MSGKSGHECKIIPTRLVGIKPLSREPPIQLPIAYSAQCQNKPRNRAPHEFIDPWEIKPWSPESVLHQSIAQSGQCPDQPKSQSQHECHDFWNQQPINPWLPAHQDQQTDCYMNPWSHGIQFHGFLHEFPYQFAFSTPFCVPSSYRRIDHLYSHLQEEAPDPKRLKTGSSNLKKADICPIEGSDNLKTVSANTVAILSSNDTTSTVDLDSTLPSNYTARTIDLHSTSPLNYKASTVDLGSTSPSNYTTRAVDLHSTSSLNFKARSVDLPSTSSSNYTASAVDLHSTSPLNYKARAVDLDSTSASNYTARPVDLDSTLPSNYTVELDATLPCSNDTASTVDLDATFPSPNDMPSILSTGSKNVSKMSSSLRTVKVNGVGGMLVQIKNKVTINNNNNDKNKVEEDVQYLYSVEPNEGKLVQLVNLSENLQVPPNQDLFQPESKNTDNSYFETSYLASLKGFTGDDTCSTLINNLKGYDQNTHEKHYRDACCNICNKSLIELHNNKCDLYQAKCGHLFCVLCIKYLNFQSQCIKCNKAVSSLRMIIL